MGVPLDHRHGLMAADALDGWKIHPRLHQMRDSGVTERVADDLCGSRPAAVTARTNALRTSTVCPCNAPTDGNSQGVPFGKVSM